MSYEEISNHDTPFAISRWFKTPEQKLHQAFNIQIKPPEDEGGPKVYLNGVELKPNKIIEVRGQPTCHYPTCGAEVEELGVLCERCVDRPPLQFCSDTNCPCLLPRIKE